jgi:hypothetical protein
MDSGTEDQRIVPVFPENIERVAPNSHAILDGTTVVPVDSLTKWASWFETGDRTVRRTWVGRYCVSSVFLGLNHDMYPFKGSGRWFETMVFGEAKRTELFDRRTKIRPEMWMSRCETWEQALRDHHIGIMFAKLAAYKGRVSARRLRKILKMAAKNAH